MSIDNCTTSTYCGKGWTPSRNLSVAQIQAYQAEIVQLGKILKSGLRSIGAEKITEYDQLAARKRLRDIYSILYPQRRPRISTVYLGGF